MAVATDETVIPTRRVRFVLATVGSLALAVFGLSLYLLDPQWTAGPRSPSQPSPDQPSPVQILGLVAFAGLGAGAMFSMNQLLTRGPGLTLSSAGLLDHTSPTATGIIPWAEITGFQLITNRRSRLLAVKLTDPEKYILRGSPLRQITSRVNVTKCGSPILISTSALHLEVDELEELCRHYLEHYGREPNHPRDGRLGPSPNSTEHLSAPAARSIMGTVSANDAKKKPT